MSEAVIGGYARSPFAPARKGALAKVRPDELMAQVVRGLLERSGADPAGLEDLIIGCAFPEGEQGRQLAAQGFRNVSRDGSWPRRAVGG